MTGKTTATTFSDRWVPWMLALIVLAGFAVRTAGAWHMRTITDPDSSVVALMAKHMALGIDYPCFFYGQLYMGTFEPAVSAVLCRIFGVSGFMVNMGTALVGIFLLPVVYVWGRDAGGRVAGLAAAAFCMVGSPAFLTYQFNPRGGYAAVIMLGALVVWMAVRSASRSYGADDHPRGFMLGLVAGFGWWVDPLIVMALAAACVVLVAGLRWKVFRPVFWLPGLIGFFVGGGPFWIWNAMHDWAGVVSLLHANSRVFSDGWVDFVRRGQRATGLEFAPAVLWWLILALYTASLLYALVQIFNRVSKRGIDRSVMALFAAVVMIVSTCLFYCTSKFSMENTSRYLLPMVPAVAVLVGCLFSAGARLHPALGLIPVIIVALMQSPSKREITKHDENAVAISRIVPILCEALPKYGIRTVYVPFIGYPLNFHTDESFDFPLINNERSHYLAERAERDPSPAYMTANREIAAFVRTAGGSLEHLNLSGVPLIHNVRPPTVNWAPLAATNLLDGSFSDKQDELKVVTDLHRGTFWYFRNSPPSNHWAEIRLKEPRDICGVRLVFPEGKLIPTFWSIEGKAEDGSWKTLLPETEITPFFWSGPRAYAGGRYARCDALFEPARVTAYRITFPTNQMVSRWGIAELTTFVPADELPAESDELTLPLINLLRERRIQTLLADRWIANEVWHQSSETIATSREKPRRPDVPVVRRDLVEVSDSLGILVRSDGADTTRDVLDQAGVTYAETPFGPWKLFDNLSGRATNIEWSGFSALYR